MTRHSSNSLSSVFGWMTIAAGCFPIAASIGFIETSPGDAPPIVLFLCGSIFVLSGLMILLGEKSSRINAAMTGGLLIMMGSIGAWVSLASPPEGFSGGLPFIPDALNILIARVVFGTGALISFSLSKVAIKQAIAPTDRA